MADGLPLFHGAQLAVDTTMGKRHIQNWRDDSDASVWLCWLVKWEEGGQRSARTSFDSWPRRRFAASHEESRSTSMVVALELPLGLQRSESVRSFPPGTTGGGGV